MYGLPVIMPIYSRMCLSFTYFLNGTLADFGLNMYIIQNETKLNLIWNETTRNSKYVLIKKLILLSNTKNNFCSHLNI